MAIGDCGMGITGGTADGCISSMFFIIEQNKPPYLILLFSPCQ
jgi:hypothetical protein